jgi:hypothetical protein
VIGKEAFHDMPPSNFPTSLPAPTAVYPAGQAGPIAAGRPRPTVGWELQ